jgi:hypothetical protein
MSLLWTAMGAAPIYQVFGGAIEVAGALLLFSRRTALLGALITAAAMANVLALNVGYSISVKHYTLHLLVASLVIVGLSWRRLAAITVGRAAPAAPPRPRFASPKIDRAVVVAGWLLAVVIVVTETRRAHALAKMNTELPPWSGIYEVTAFAVEGQEVPPHFGNRARWRQVTVYPGAFVVDLGDDAREIWRAKRDEAAHTFTVRLDDQRDYERPLTTPETTLHYDDQDPDRIEISGELGTRSVAMRLRRVRPTFRLLQPSPWLDDGSFQR